MKTMAMTTALLLGVLGVAISDSAFAQTTLGGAKPQQNKIGGAAKPPPAIGGATTASPSIKPGPAGITKQASSGTKPLLGTGNATLAGQTAGPTKPNPPVTPLKKNTAVSTSSNLKCAAGACTTRGPKP
jgi:hypothetical protein